MSGEPALTPPLSAVGIVPLASDVCPTTVSLGKNTSPSVDV